MLVRDFIRRLNEWQRAMKVLKSAAVLMVLLSLTYVSCAVYAASVSNVHLRYSEVLYAAVKYESDDPPLFYYLPEELGIIEIHNHGRSDPSWVHVSVDPQKEPFPLQKEEPIFLYEEKFYQISPLWTTAGLASNSNNWQVPIGGALLAGWLSIGIFSIKRPKE